MKPHFIQVFSMFLSVLKGKLAFKMLFNDLGDVEKIIDFAEHVKLSFGPKKDAVQFPAVGDSLFLFSSDTSPDFKQS